MVDTLSKFFSSLLWRRLRLLLVLAIIIWGVAFPSAFLNLWLTPDQQGRLWFQLGHYERAYRSFEDPRWRGFSLYAGEDFATAERYFSQYQDAESLLARANSLAHQSDYAAAKKGFEELAESYPDHPAPAINVPIMQALIEATKGVGENSEESGESSKKSGQGSESSDGTGKAGRGEREQYSAEQLLQDPGLTEMWLRQIQRDPSEFLTTKFYLQLEQKEEKEP